MENLTPITYQTLGIILFAVILMRAEPAQIVLDWFGQHDASDLFITAVTEAELRRLVSLDLTTVDVIEAAFATLARGGVQMPPILSMHLPELNAELDVKTAYVPGLSGFAVKISPGFFDNPARGLPSTSGLMVVLSSQTGRVRAVLLDNGYLTDIRTAAAGGVAARWLAKATY